MIRAFVQEMIVSNDCGPIGSVISVHAVCSMHWGGAWSGGRQVLVDLRCVVLAKLSFMTPANGILSHKLQRASPKSKEICTHVFASLTNHEHFDFDVFYR